MPLIVSPVTDADIPIIVAIEHAAVVQSPLNPLAAVRQKLFNLTPGHKQEDEEYLRQMERIVRAGFARRVKDNSYFFKVTDTDIPAHTDKYRGIISFLVWRIETRGGRDNLTRRRRQEGGSGSHRPATHPRGIDGDEQAEPHDQRISAFADTAVGRELNRLAALFRKECFPNEPYLLFEVGMTLPAYWRCGALSLLLGRALEMADERGIISVMQASEMGWPLYKSLGFEVVKETALDLEPFGVNASVPHRDMIRRPRAPGRILAKL